MMPISSFASCKRALTWSAATSLLAYAFIGAGVATAQSRSSGGSSKGSRDFAVALPLLLNGESSAKLELNIAGQVSLGLEIQSKGKREELAEKTVEETKESMISSARGLSLMVSRYAQPTRMAGFYWTLGAGYREMNTTWRVRPDSKDKSVDMSLLDADQTLHHQAKLTGITGHARIGYRYVAEEMPLMIGAYFGLRHFAANTTEDINGLNQEGSDGPTYSEMSKQEKDRLERRHMTRVEPAIEVGLVF